MLDATDVLADRDVDRLAALALVRLLLAARPAEELRTMLADLAEDAEAVAGYRLSPVDHNALAQALERASAEVSAALTARVR